MPFRPIPIVCCLVAFAGIIAGGICLAQEDTVKVAAFCNYPFLGKIEGQAVNVRTDATVSSDIICQLNAGEIVTVVQQRYQWYKIRLPKFAPAFVSKNLLTLIDDKAAVVSRDRVNVRLAPNENSPIIGKLSRNERVSVTDTAADWYKIEPAGNTFGWIHQQFILEFKQELPPAAPDLIPQEKKAPPVDPNAVVLTGVIKPKTFTRIATHKLIDPQGRVYLLDGPKDVLLKLENRRVRISGTIEDPANKKYPIIVIKNTEVLD